MNPKKETIIFVHGAWHGKWCWEKHFTKVFKESGFEVVTFDLPGHDKSGKIKGINKFSLKDYVNALKAEVDKLSTTPIIIGHSMGGLILQKYLEKGSCKKAILLASASPYGVIKTTLKFSKKWFFYPSLFGLNLYGLVNSESKSRDAFFSENLPPEALTEYTTQLCSESFMAFLDMLVPQVKITEKSNIPILVVGAENDTIFSITDQKKIATKFKGELIIVKDIAHNMMLDVNHEKVSSLIIGWLNKNIG
jgi:Lysophospholipase